jgi:hypothetical protein
MRVTGIAHLILLDLMVKGKEKDEAPHYLVFSNLLSLHPC